MVSSCRNNGTISQELRYPFTGTVVQFWQESSRPKSGGGNVKILLPETEAQGLAGSGEQRKESAGRVDELNIPVR